METWMSGALLIEVTIVSFLVALWVAWISLRGLFRVLPATRLNAVPIRSATRRGIDHRGA
jgi:hypothetical protein